MVLEKTLESPLVCKEIQPVKDISPGCSLEGMMLKLKLQYFGHLVRRVDSLEDSDAGRDRGQEEEGTTEDEMAGWHQRRRGGAQRRAPWGAGTVRCPSLAGGGVVAVCTAVLAKLRVVAAVESAP